LTENRYVKKRVDSRIMTFPSGELMIEGLRSRKKRFCEVRSRNSKGIPRFECGLALSSKSGSVKEATVDVGNREKRDHGNFA
jgi:hypothetical protein